jgi:hypothetical protein
MRWQRHRAALASVIPFVCQWVDGSYVTNKLDPADIDVVTIMDGLVFEALAPALQDMVGALVAGKGTKALWGVDSYAIFTFPDDHASKVAEKAATDQWDAFWSRVREDDDGVKGYLEVLP